MTEQNPSLLNRLDRDLPEGLTVDGAWLETKGYASNLRSYYTKVGWLNQPARGVYRRGRGPLKWQQVVISLQSLLLNRYGPVIVGGRTSLELQGYGHYLSKSRATIHLYGPKPLPSWVAKLPLQEKFAYHNSDRLFDGEMKSHQVSKLTWDSEQDKGRDLSKLQDSSLTELEWGQWDWSLSLSKPERAILELLDELPKHESFHQVDKLMEGLSNLSPNRLQRLLHNCRSVKVKRLFFFFADRHPHAWRKKLDVKAFDLGAGKRSLVPGGRLDPIYNITVPEDLDANQ